MIQNRYGQLVVLSAADPRGSHKMWNCLCDCGSLYTAWQLSLRRGTTKSCGCTVRAARSARWASYREPAFWARVQKADDTACWPWTGLQKQGPKNPSPYGSLRWKGRTATAHRVAYELTNGEVPVGAMVLHSCDNSLCCNPQHLYLGDHARNMRDMVERGRRVGKGVGQENGRAKLTQGQAEDIRRAYAEGRGSQQAIANTYGVSQHAVSKITRGLRYK